MDKKTKFPDLDAILESVQEKLAGHGIDIDLMATARACSDHEGPHKVKVVCVTPDLKDSMDEMGHAPRDKVIMVRVDEETSAALDAWVETGAVKSRSEAAALFIREGLKVRKDELDSLQDALSDVARAKEKLRKKAGEVFGGSGG